MIKLTLALVLTLGLTAVAHAETCGQIMAEKAVLPATMSKVMTAVADMVDAHVAFMAATNKTPESKKEMAAYKKLANEHRDLAKRFAKTAENMKKLADLPGADHDIPKMEADPKIVASMGPMLATHKEMAALIQKEIAEMEAQAKGKK